MFTGSCYGKHLHVIMYTKSSYGKRIHMIVFNMSGYGKHRIWNASEASPFSGLLVLTIHNPMPPAS